LDRGSEFRVDGVGWDQDVANAFGQASGHASQGAEELLGLLSEQASAFHQLQEQMGELQQDIEVLDLPLASAVGMLQIKVRRSSGC